MFPRRPQDVFKMSLRRLQDVFMSSSCPLHVVLKTPSRHLHVFKISWRRLQYNNFRLPRRLEEVFARCLQDILEGKTLLPWKHVEEVLKTNKCLLGSFFNTPEIGYKYSVIDNSDSQEVSILISNISML